MLLTTLVDFGGQNGSPKSTMVFSPEQKIKIVRLWFETKSYVTVRRRLRRECDMETRDLPCNKLIARFVNHFETTGSVLNTHRGSSGRPASVSKSPETIAAVRNSVIASPKKSLRRRSQQLGLAKTSVRRILCDELKLSSYIISTRHKMTDRDRQKRQVMCQWISNKMERNARWVNRVWFSDEAHFHLNGAVNNHNNTFWGNSPPEEVTEKQLKGPKVTAFVAYNATHGLLGPYWFEEDGRTITINGERYREVIREFYADLTDMLTDNQLQQAWFMQDGAPPHTARESIECLKELFNARLMSLGTAHEWAPHSPDLNPLDFWLWGAAKDTVYAGKPKTLVQLKQNVERYLHQVGPETLTKVAESFQARIKACLNRGGAHIENVNYKKFA